MSVYYLINACLLSLIIVFLLDIFDFSTALAVHPSPGSVIWRDNQNHRVCKQRECGV